MTLTNEKTASILATLDKLLEPLQEAANQLGYPDSFVRNVCLASALNVAGVCDEIRFVCGSAKWLVMTNEEQGDAILAGRSAAPFYGYEFNFNKAMPIMVDTTYPEDMHCWVVGDHCIFDASGKSVMQEYESVAGAPWTQIRALPDLIEGMPDDLEANGWFYSHHEKASSIVGIMVSRLFAVATVIATQNLKSLLR